MRKYLKITFAAIFCLSLQFQTGFGQSNDGSSAGSEAAILISRAKAAIEKGDFVTAATDLAAAIKIEPTNDTAFTQRARIYVMTGNFDSALADAERAIALNPQNAEALNIRGVYKQSRKEYDAAIIDYTQAIAITPGFIKAYLNRGNTFAAKNDLGKAAADFRKVLELDPDNQPAKKELAKLPVVPANKTTANSDDDDDDSLTAEELEALKKWATKKYKNADDERCRTASFTTSAPPPLKDEMLVDPQTINAIIKSCDAAILSDASVPSRNFYRRALARYYLIRGFNAPLGQTLSTVETVSDDDLRLTLGDLETYLGWTDPDNKSTLYDLRKMGNIMVGELLAVAAYKEKKPQLLFTALDKLAAAKEFKSESLLDTPGFSGKNDALNGVITQDQTLIEAVLKKNGLTR